MRFFDERIGQGEPVIFLPGTGWSGREGLIFADRLQTEFEVFLVDLPGIGRSEALEGPVNFADMAKWVADYLDARGLHRVHLIGHSLGGAIAMAFAVYYPERAQSLVLLDIGYQRVPRFPVREFGKIGYVVPFISVAERLFGSAFLRKLADNDADDESGMSVDDRVAWIKERGWYHLEDDRYLRDTLTYEPSLSAGGMSLLLGLYRSNEPKLMTRLTTPTCLLYGTHPTQDEKYRRRLQAKILRLKGQLPNIRFEPVEGGHYVHWSNADVVHQVADFLAEHAQKAEAPTEK